MRKEEREELCNFKLEFRVRAASIYISLVLVSSIKY